MKILRVSKTSTISPKNLNNTTQPIYLKTTNYIIIETLALLQSRLGFEAAHLYSSDILGIVDVLWVKEPRHNLAFELWLGLGRKKLSLVDCVSFITMRHYQLGYVFGFDRHFDEQGFQILD